MTDHRPMPDLTTGWRRWTQGIGEKSPLGRADQASSRTWILAVLGIVMLLSVTQQFAKLETKDLTSSGTWVIALAWSVPILMAGLGGIFSERTGIVNIGLEGMLVLGTWFGAFGTLVYGPWWGMVIAAIAGAFGGALLALATVTFNVDHIVAGVAINIMAPGITRFLASIHFPDRGGSITQSPTMTGVSSFSLPFLAGGNIGSWESPDMLGRIESWDWFFVSDFAGIMRGFVWQMSWLTLLAILIVPAATYLLWKTAFGLRLRSCGENPYAADSLGVNVYKYKYYGVIIGGALAGFGGGFLSVQLTGIYREGQTLGKGFIGLATMIFGNWRPVGTALGALLFGFTETLRLRDPNAAHGLLLLITIGLAILIARALLRRRYQVALSLGLTAALIFIWYLSTDSVPNQLPRIAPNIAVLVVMVFATQRLRMPAADGQPYRKGEGG
ncbi:MAG: ABC transporter permease [Acidimicrobiia bacterium]|nr:ABC transporter permease [Acidimicrobiia bacterium]